MTATTDATGKITFDLGKGTAADGVYIITELEDDRVATPEAPFFVTVPQTSRQDNGSLIYDVVVQPKNVVKSIVDPDKTIEGEKGYSIKAGEQFTWEAATNIPSGLYQVASQDMTISPVYDKDGNQIADLNVKAGDEIYANYFTIKDTLVKELLLDNAIMQVKKDSGAWEDLVFGTDYEVTLNGTKVSSLPVTDTSNADKALEFTLTQAGMKKVTEGKYTDIRGLITTHTDKDFNGIIDNQMNVSYLVPGQKPTEVTPPEEDKPKLYDGGLDIEKTAEDTKELLAGAEFHISLTEDDAKNGIFLAANGKTYGSGSVAAAEAAAQADGTTLLIAVTDSQGRAEFNGLALDVPTTLPIDEAQVKRTYWVTETKAPEGYELLKEAQAVEVNLTTENNTTVELAVEDKPKTDLPFTGGQGTAVLITIAMGTIALGSALVVMDKKRRKA
ncbi:SpaH/EbpB family LPXTG-anchored major pilin [Enterococcus termitis]